MNPVRHPQVDDLRPAIRASLVQAGVAAHSVDEITDLDLHAAEKASESFQRVIFSAGGGASVLANAIQIGVPVAKVLLDTLSAAALKTAVGMGGRVAEFTIGGKP